ncbi:MAG: UPF0489 family protein [Candidatus Omnitrophica bacterium]|nr:UPF0489 family protein [Candidatus Omnitrophota bacterium]MCM8830747.1 UPF0489 family protein [Candidatus Omnitrophota bacterium]
MEKIYIVEDHHQVLNIWKKQKIKNLDVVHIDAHLDWQIFLAKPIEQILDDSKTIKQLKKELENTLLYFQYQNKLENQTNIGNYLYSAKKANIIKNIWWIVPSENLCKDIKLIKRFFFYLAKESRLAKKPNFKLKNKILKVNLADQTFYICTLKQLPEFKKEVILDIDIDFFVINNLDKADNTDEISKRKLWIEPKDVANILKEKIKNYKIITISCSVNDGFTPIEFRYIASELAFYFSPQKFKNRFLKKFKAHINFLIFKETKKSFYYWQAVKLDKAYRCKDNNFGFLYLKVKKFNLAKKEFESILAVDKTNPAVLLGLGFIYFYKKKLKKAKKYLYRAFYFSKIQKFFSVYSQIIFLLAKLEFKLKNFNISKKFFLKFIKVEPIEPEAYYYLARIYILEKNFKKATNCLKHLAKLGWVVDSLFYLAKILNLLRKDKYDIIKFIKQRLVFIKNKKLKKIRYLKDVLKKIIYAR